MNTGTQDAISESLTQLAIDCAANNVAHTLVEANALSSWHFRSFSYVNRPQRAHEKPNTVALQYFRFGVGGAERVTLELMKLFVGMGLRVLLYTDEPETDGDYPVPEGVIRKHVSAGYDDPLGRVNFWLSEVAAENIDIMVYNSWCAPSALVDCLGIQAAGAAFVFHAHSNAAYCMQIDDPPLLERLRKVAYIADEIIGLSPADSVFWSAFNNNVFIAVNPIELYMREHEPRSGVPAGRTVLWCGRLAPEKRPEEAIKIMAHLHKLVPDATLELVGDGDNALVASLHKLARDLDIENVVKFEGFQADTLSYYRRANAMLLTSVVEGFPLALSEAMQQGAPAVIYELPYLPLAQAGGVIQTPQLDCEQAALALAAVLTDAALQEQLGKQARLAYERVCCIDFEDQWRTIFARATQASAPTRNDSTTNIMVQAMLYEHELRIAKQDARIAQLTQERNGLAAELAAQLDSKTYKIGRAVTAAPRALRDILQSDSDQ